MKRLAPESVYQHIDALLGHGELANYYLAHSARADVCRRLDGTSDARSAYEKALELTQQEPEPQFLQQRIRQFKQKHFEYLRRDLILGRTQFPLTPLTQARR